MLVNECQRLASRGWDALVEKLGYADATRFVMMLDKGSGDSVTYFRELWKDTSAEEIYRRMMVRRQRNGERRPAPPQVRVNE
jgi:hypothetical protein